MKPSHNEYLFIDLINQGYLEIDNENKVWRLARRYKSQFAEIPFISIKKRRMEYKNEYGYLCLSGKINGKQVNCFAYRVVWVYFNGEIPDNLQINHINGIKTDNRLKNLEIVTQLENEKHAFKIGLKPNGEKHGRAKLTNEKVREIRNRYKKGELQRKIAKDFNISRQHISNIVNRKQWTHIE